MNDACTAKSPKVDFIASSSLHRMKKAFAAKS